MKQNKQGFTLIELVAVIILIAIIALIAIPAISDLLTEARKSAFEDTAYGVIRAGELYYEKQLMKTGKGSEYTFTFPDATGLEVSGKKPDTGSMKINNKGKVALAISNGEYCATKGFDDAEVTLSENVDSCTLGSE